MKTVRLVLRVMLLSAMLCVACCEMAPSTNDKNLIHLTYKGLNQMIADGKSLMLIDIRLPAAYEQGHIPGAVNIPDPEQFMFIGPSDKRLNEASQVVIYGDGSHTNYTDSAAKRLIAMGYTEVFSYPGGWQEWQKWQTPEGGATPEPAKPEPAKPEPAKPEPAK